MSTIDLAAERDRRHGPDPEHVYRDGMGAKWIEYLVEYEDGATVFSFTIWAIDAADAERRLGLIRAGSMVCGQVYTIVPA